MADRTQTLSSLRVLPPVRRTPRPQRRQGFPNELPDVAAKIGMELRNQYVLGYSPTNTVKDGKYRRVQVKVKQVKGMPPLKAFFRLGYYAPAQ